MTENEWSRAYGKLDRKDPRAIRAFLSTESTHAYHVFLQLLMSNATGTLVVEFEKARKTMRKLTAYEWGASQKRRNFEALAADPNARAAIQGAAARGTNVPMDMLAVLVMDGSAESIDALVPHFDPALVATDGRLEWLKRLKKFAGKAPAIQKLFVEVNDTLDAREAVSPALALGPVIGIGAVKTVSFDIRIGSAELNPNHVPWIQGEIDIDSRSSTWFRVWLSRVEPMSLGGAGRDHYDMRNDKLHADTFGIGACTPAQLPVWLAHTATTIGNMLELGTPRTNLRGKKREQLMAWLTSRMK